MVSAEHGCSNAAPCTDAHKALPGEVNFLTSVSKSTFPTSCRSDDTGSASGASTESTDLQ